MALKKITESDLAGKGNLGKPDTPGVTTGEMQRILDELPREVIVPAFNELSGELEAETAATQLGAAVPGTEDLPADTPKTVQGVLAALLAWAKGKLALKADKATTYTKTETDSFLAKAYNLAGGQVIASGNDMNTIAAVGNYTVDSDALAITLVNCPVNVAFRLAVMQIAGAEAARSQTRKQILEPRNSSRRERYMNTADSGSSWTFGPWVASGGGAGTVVTVDGIEPDQFGDIELTLPAEGEEAGEAVPFDADTVNGATAAEIGQAANAYADTVGAGAVETAVQTANGYTDEQIAGFGRYSTEERWTGEYWIDGRKIYRKTFVLDNISAGARSFDHGISNIGSYRIFDWSGTYFFSATSQAFPGALVRPNLTAREQYENGLTEITLTNIHFYKSTRTDQGAFTAYITIRYTCTDR